MEALHTLLQKTEAGRAVLNRARELDKAVITIKRILSLHIGYKWRCEKYAVLNCSESSATLLKTLQGQLSSREPTVSCLGNMLQSTVGNTNTNINRSADTSRQDQYMGGNGFFTLSSGAMLKLQRKRAPPASLDSHNKRPRTAIGKKIRILFLDNAILIEIILTRI